MITRSLPTRLRPALLPQRRQGKARFAALLRAGAEVIADRGFEAATMAEIAARAEAPIGSLYRFFPKKDALATALMRQYVELIDAAFARLAATNAQLSAAEFADALLASLADVRGETQAAVVALLDARPDFSARRDHLLGTIRGHIGAVLLQRDPRLGEQKVRHMTTVLLHNMKMMKSLHPDDDAGAIAELRSMTRAYLANELGDASA